MTPAADGTAHALAHRRSRGLLLPLLAIFLDRLHHPGGRGGQKWRPVVAHPFHAAARVGVRILKAWHDVAGDHLVAPPCRIAVRPLVCGDEKRTEAATLLLESVDLGNEIIRRADDHEPGADHRIQAL